jgi:hypothetical protein
MKTIPLAVPGRCRATTSAVLHPLEVEARHRPHADPLAQQRQRMRAGGHPGRLVVGQHPLPL